MSINPPFIRTGDVTLGVRQQDIATYPIDDLTPVVNFVAPGSRPAVNAIDINAKDGYVQQWNFYLERSVSESLVVKAGYVGTKSTGLDAFRYNNQPLAGSRGRAVPPSFPKHEHHSSVQIGRVRDVSRHGTRCPTALFAKASASPRDTPGREPLTTAESMRQP